MTTNFRFAPTSLSFAACGPAGDVAVHPVYPDDAFSSHANRAPTAARLVTELPTRVAEVSWLHVDQPAPLLAGAADTKVCLWALKASGGNGNGAESVSPIRPMAMLM